MSYYHFDNESDDGHGILEVFHVDQDQGLEPGWYWQTLFPESLQGYNEGPNGPFKSEDAAMAEASVGRFVVNY